MPPLQRRWCFLALVIATTGPLYYLTQLQDLYILSGNAASYQPAATRMITPSGSRSGSATNWANFEQHYPVVPIIPLLTDKPKIIPTIQQAFDKKWEDAKAKNNRKKRRQIVIKHFNTPGRATSGHKSTCQLVSCQRSSTPCHVMSSVVGKSSSISLPLPRE